MLDTRAAAQHGRAAMKNEVKEEKRIRIAIFCQAAISMQHSLPAPRDPAFF